MMNKIKAYTTKNAPEIFLGISIVTGISAAVAAFFEAPKLAQTLQACKVTTAQIDEALAHPETAITEDGTPYDEKDAINDRKLVKSVKTKAIIQTVVPVAALEIVSVVSALASYGVLKGRETAAIATATAIGESFDAYRKRVAAEVGDEKEKDIFEGKKKIVTKNAETGEETITYETPSNVPVGTYDFLFDECNSIFHTKDAFNNIMFARKQEDRLNAVLKANGYLFLKDVYDAFGKTCDNKIAAINGWIYNPKDTHKANYVDLGITSLYDKALRGMDVDCNFWIRPNCDGIIVGEGLNDFSKFAKN